MAKPAPKSLRQKTGRRRGGQPGHPGRTLQPVEKPDHLVPHRLGRCPCGLCQGRWLHDQPLSQATVVRANQRVYEILDPFEQAVKGQLSQAPLVHADESGLRVAGKLHGLHVVSTAYLTFYGMHRKRGRMHDKKVAEF